MKTTLLIVRHGESLGNLHQQFLGHTDLGLTELGLRQADALAAALRNRHIDAVYSSDLSRAMQTVTPTARDHGISVVPTVALREIFAGDWEGENYDRLAEKWPEERERWRYDIGRACPTNGESVAALYDRVAAALDEIATREAGHTVLIGTHATPVRATVARLLGVGVLGMADVAWAGNASITTVVYEDGVPTLVGQPDSAHLSEMATFVPSNI